MQKLPLILFCMITLLGCKKDKLKGEKEILIGTWEWVYSEHEQNICNPPSYVVIESPQTELRNYLLEFMEQGKLVIYKNGDLYEKGRIVFKNWFKSSNNNGYSFKIYVNNKEKKIIDGNITQDTLTLWRAYYFFNSEEDCYTGLDKGCCSYTSYYTRQ